MPSVQDALTALSEGKEVTLTEWQEIRVAEQNRLGEVSRERDEAVQDSRNYYEAANDANKKDVSFDEATWQTYCARVDLLSRELKKPEDDYRHACNEIDRLERIEREQANVPVSFGTDGQAVMGESLSEFPRNGVYNEGQLPMVRGGSVDQHLELDPETYIEKGVDRSAMDYRKAFHAFASAHHKNRVTAEVMNALTPYGDSGENYLYAPPQVLSLFLRGCDKYTFVRSLATVITAPNVQSTGMRKRTKKTSSFAWGCECERPVCDTPGFGMRTLQPQPYSFCSCLCRALLRRSVFNLEAFIADELSRDSAEKQEEAFFIGDGVKKPLGIFTASPDGITTDQDIQTQNAGVLTSDDIVRTWMALPLCRRATSNLNTQTQTGGAVWMMHGDWLTQIMLLKTGDGQYIWRPWVRDGYPSELLGRPVYESEFAPNGVATGDYVLALGDMSDYMIVDGPNIALERDDDIFTDQACWVGRGYVDGAPVQEESFKRLQLS